MNSPRLPFQPLRLGLALKILGLLAIVTLLSLMIGVNRQQAPALTLLDLNGHAIDLPGLRGKVVLVNFWAPSCGPCVREMPMLSQHYPAWQRAGLEIIAIASPQDAPNLVVEYNQRARLPFPVALDLQGEAGRAFGGISAIPTSFVIDRQGRIVRKIVGMIRVQDIDALLTR